MPSADSSSARGGRSSAANTGEPERRAVRKSILQVWMVGKDGRAGKVQTFPTVVLPLLALEHFVDQEQVGEQGAKVYRGVEVVDHLRADRWLREHEGNGCPRGARILVDHLQERRVGGERVAVDALRERGDEGGEAAQCGLSLAQELPHLRTLRTAGVARESLAGV